MVSDIAMDKQMKNYRNNKFYNIVLPTLLFLAMIASVVAFFITNQGRFLFITIGICLSFKFIHQWLERLSVQQRKDNGLTSNDGALYSGNLSDADEREMLRIKEQWNGD
jgi:hypothetical protein